MIEFIRLEVLRGFRAPTMTNAMRSASLCLWLGLVSWMLPGVAVAMGSDAAADDGRAGSSAGANVREGVLRVPLHIETPPTVGHSSVLAQGGVPLPRGAAAGDSTFRVLDASGAPVAAQVNTLAWWPDGSLKWVLVLVTTPLEEGDRRRFTLEVMGPGVVTAGRRIEVLDTEDSIKVSTGVVRFVVPKRGSAVFQSLELLGADISVPTLAATHAGTLFAELERRRPDGLAVTSFEAGWGPGDGRAVLEESGSERVVIRIEGVHRSVDGETFAPFTLRLYASAGSSTVRFVHFFTFDADPDVDALRAIGFRMSVGLGGVSRGRLAGEFGTGQRIDHVPDSNRPAWQRARLSQVSSGSYLIRKWTDPERHSAVLMEEGERSQGWGALQGEAATLTLGLRNFWQEYPKAIEVDVGARRLVAYFYDSYGGVLDLRRYSDRTHAELYETSSSGPEPAPVEPESDWSGRITNADLGARHIGKTSEFFVDLAAGADLRRPGAVAWHVQSPPRLTPGVAWIARCRVFGDYVTAEDSPLGTAGAALLAAATFLREEQEHRRWYSFLDYGDMVHSFDPARDVWCRDEGGYAWNNNEHCIAEGLWTAYLYSGDPRTFRLAEAMTRHVGDVDMYHGGPLAGNGTRHNVNHYGCVAKKRRMTLPENKRIHYFLTGDEHTRDLIHFVYQSFRENQLEQEALGQRRNTMDLAVYASALLFLWETSGDPERGRLLRLTTEAMCAERVGGRGIRQYVRFDPVTGASGPPEGAGLAETKFRLAPRGSPAASGAQTRSFLLKFGPMDLLIATAELTGSEIVHGAILEWAELLKMPEAEAANYQGRFRPAMDCARVAAYAHRHTGDPAYSHMIEDWLADPVVWFESVGRTGDLFDPVHLVPRNGDRQASPEVRARERFQLRDMADLLRNVPYAGAALKP